MGSIVLGRDRRRIVGGALVALALLGAGCGDGGQQVATEDGAVQALLASADAMADETSFRYYSTITSDDPDCPDPFPVIGTMQGAVDLDAVVSVLAYPDGGGEVVGRPGEVLYPAALTPERWGVTDGWVSLDELDMSIVSSEISGLLGSTLEPIPSGAEDDVQLPTELLAEVEDVAASVSVAGTEDIRGTATTRYDIVLDPEPYLDWKVEQEIERRERLAERYPDRPEPPEELQSRFDPSEDEIRASLAQQIPENSVWLDADGLIRRWTSSSEVVEWDATWTSVLELWDYGIDLSVPPDDAIVAFADLDLPPPPADVDDVFDRGGSEDCLDIGYQAMVADGVETDVGDLPPLELQSMAAYLESQGVALTDEQRAELDSCDEVLGPSFEDDVDDAELQRCIELLATLAPDDAWMLTDEADLDLTRLLLGLDPDLSDEQLAELEGCDDALTSLLPTDLDDDPEPLTPEAGRCFEALVSAADELG